MTRRYAQTAETVELLIDTLEQQGVLSAEWAAALREAEGPGEAREAKEAHREGRGPPEWAGGGSGSSDGPPRDAEGGPTGGE